MRLRDNFVRYSIHVVLWVGLVACACRATLAADVITGQVRNQTRSQPAANDVVILLRAEHGLREEARTRTDARGSFTLTPGRTEKAYLLRIVHDGVNYDQQISPGDLISVDVFDAAAQLEGITGSIEIIRAGTVGNQLHVSDMIEIKNGSSPPRTQAGERTFDIYLPATAKLDSVLAAGPANVAEMISAEAVPGDSGHYSVSFPLRPGATKFAFNYDLPYEGNAAFHTRHAYPLHELAVMIPPSMRFSSRSAGFKLLNTGNAKYQARAYSPVAEGRGPEFEISGIGVLPTIAQPRSAESRSAQAAPGDSTVAKSPTPVAPPAATQRPTTDGNPAPVRARLSSRQFWPLGVLGMVVAVACGLAVKQVGAARRAQATTSVQQASSRQAVLFDGLKEEFFQLEASRIRGTISAEQYAATRSTLEAVVKRTVQRAS